VWLAFGAIGVPIMLERASWTILLYAVLSLTVVRMIPVALALFGAGLDPAAVRFIGWFGPRGLASLLFALLALEQLGSDADEAVAVITVTVLLSVVAHGISAAPLAARFGRLAAAHGPEPGGPVPDLPVRGLPRRRPAVVGAGRPPAESAPPEPGGSHG
jgi:sodium/hydrogen antiporter